MRFAIIGCGLIGQKRLRSFKDRHILTVASDVIPARAQSLASQSPRARVEADWKTAVAAPDVDAVIVATTNDSLAPVTLAAIEAGRPVLVEKPAARSVQEITPLIEQARLKGVHVQVGFNHRYHPAFRQARQILDSGVLGDLMFIRARYGHGGRVGYDREWRADPKLSGGGELIDQGVHLIDLSRMFLGDFTSVEGFAKTFYWDMPVDDNAFLLLRTREEKTASLHVSCTEWKNLFSLEIYGRSGKLHIEGLGGSYGPEKLTHYRMLPEMGRPEMKTWEFAAADESWRLETAEFLSGVNTTNLDDARAAHVIVGEIYRRSGYESD